MTWKITWMTWKITWKKRCSKFIYTTYTKN